MAKTKMQKFVALLCKQTHQIPSAHKEEIDKALDSLVSELCERCSDTRLHALLTELTVTDFRREFIVSNQRYNTFVAFGLPFGVRPNKVDESTKLVAVEFKVLPAQGSNFITEKNFRVDATIYTMNMEHARDATDSDVTVSDFPDVGSKVLWSQFVESISKAIAVCLNTNASKWATTLQASARLTERRARALEWIGIAQH